MSEEVGLSRPSIRSLCVVVFPLLFAIFLLQLCPCSFPAACSAKMPAVHARDTSSAAAPMLTEPAQRLVDEAGADKRGIIAMILATRKHGSSSLQVCLRKTYRRI